MLPAPRLLRLQASCLTWRRLENQRLSLRFGRRQISINGGKGGKGGDGASNRSRSTQGAGAGAGIEKAKGQADAERAEEAERAKNLALLRELFPEEAQRYDADTGLRKRDREVPRLALDAVDKPRNAQHNGTAPPPPLIREPGLDWDMPSLVGAERNTRRRFEWLQRQIRRQRGEAVGVLVLRNASKSLIEDDFHRLVPQGKHIEGWSQGTGDIVKVIPGRDTSTLERLNFYVLLFKSPLAAYQYQSHVTRLHTLAKSSMPRSITSPIPPPPGYLVHGQDVTALLKSYALVPPSVELELRQLSYPFSPSIQQLVESHGYPAIVDQPNRSPAEVLMRFEGPQLSMASIKSGITKASRDRGLPWTGREHHDIRIKRWEPQGSNVSLMGPRKMRVPREEQAADPSTPDEPDAFQTGSAKEDDRRPRRRPASSFILGFDTDAEAQTFVRYWHRRPMLLANFSYRQGDIAPIVNAEILW